MRIRLGFGSQSGRLRGAGLWSGLCLILRPRRESQDLLARMANRAPRLPRERLATKTKELFLKPRASLGDTPLP